MNEFEEFIDIALPEKDMEIENIFIIQNSLHIYGKIDHETNVSFTVDITEKLAKVLLTSKYIYSKETLRIYKFITRQPIRTCLRRMFSSIMNRFIKCFYNIYKNKRD